MTNILETLKARLNGTPFGLPAYVTRTELESAIAEIVTLRAKVDAAYEFSDIAGALGRALAALKQMEE